MLPKPHWVVINRKLLRPVAGVLLLSLIVLTLIILTKGPGSQLPPEALFARAMQETAAADTFRYRMEVGIGREEKLSQVEGERVAPDRIHIRGAMQKTPLEFIHIAGTTYMKDPWSEDWLTIPESSLNMAELFIAELNPLGNLDFKEITEIKHLGQKKVKGKQLAGVELIPVINNPLLATQYDTFIVDVWIDPDSMFIQNATIEGTGNGAGEKIYITLELWDFNSDLKIVQPPGI